MGTVAFHKDGTAGRKLEDTAIIVKGIYISKLHVHAGELLLEEFSGTGGALVSRKAVDYFFIFVDCINNKIFSAQGNHRVSVVIQLSQRLFDAERFNDTVDV